MDYIIFDLEATCFDRNENKPQGFRNEIIEIGAVKVAGNGLVVDEFQAFIHPYKFPTLSNFCKTLTSITQKDVDDAEYFPNVLQNFRDWSGLADFDVKFVSWGHYDRNQLRDDCDLHKIDKAWITEANHMSLKHKHSEWNNLNVPKGVGLGSACKFEKIKFEGTAHRGIDDAKNIAKIFVKYLDKVNNA